MVRDVIFWMDKYPDVVVLTLQLYSICHAIFCIIAAYGAYKLKRFFVVPLAILESVYIVQIITLFILFLRIVRHFLSLGKLILLTLSATAYSFLTVYDLFALVAFEQIIALVRSKRYQQLYGSDPFNPILNHNTEQQLKEHPTIVYVMPKANANLPKWWQVDSLQHNNRENIMLHDAHRYF
ncbi:uncharacterized protein LOC116805223 [Drosophila grimshawi]|uniref:uncharacterized protein LOC116805223 n=1 Tax=Drosophila grimshawi TaxID=7222 RepID=UPI0013EF0A9E|nr:uncharacterized protein LOC116805223 [Drosophila grimshawi]